MTNAQEAHLHQLIKETGAIMDAKYRHEQEEHGGNLFELSPLALIEEGSKEAVDQLVYLMTARNALLEGGFKYGAPGNRH
jgi:hypothetical protein